MSAPPPPILGWQNAALPFRMATPLGSPRGVGVVFPGAAYGQDRPLCALARDVLVAAGVESFLSDRSYAMDADVRTLTGEEREACLAADGGAFARAAYERAAGLPVVLAGKSLGTASMGHALAQVPDLVAGWSVWLTPLWKDVAIFNAIAGAGERAFVLIGTADPQWDEELRAALDKRAMKVARSLPRIVAVPGADHGMSVKGNPAATAAVLTELQPALAAHLAAALAPPVLVP
jgi:hypothetical protein